MNIIRNEQNGIEFFTVSITGESGLSQTGLALLSGVSHQAINQLISVLASKSPSKWLEPWTDKDLTLASSYSSGDQKTRNVTIYKAEFCAAVIQHYAFKGNETAQESLHKFSSAGITLWIQRQTGWQSAQSLNLQKASRAKFASEEVKAIYANVAEINPRLCQFLIDAAINEIMGNQQALPCGDAPLMGVVEIAIELGYKPTPKVVSMLGKFVKKHCGHLAKTEKRLVGGALRPVCVYPSDNPKVKEAIQAFFADTKSSES